MSSLSAVENVGNTIYNLGNDVNKTRFATHMERNKNTTATQDKMVFYGNKRSLKKAFLAALAEVAIIGRAAKRVGLSRSTIYRWLKEDEEFSQDAEGAYLEAYRKHRDELDAMPHQTRPDIFYFLACAEMEAEKRQSSN